MRPPPEPPPPPPLLVLVLLLASTAEAETSQQAPDGVVPISADSLTGGTRALSHWNHPLLRQWLFRQLSDPHKAASYTKALQTALRRTTEAILSGATSLSRKGKRKMPPRIEMLEYGGSGCWTVTAFQWLAAQQQSQPARSTVRLHATVVAQEPVYAELARLTLLQNNLTDALITVLYTDAAGTWRTLSGGLFDIKKSLGKLDLVVCDGFGSSITRLVEQSAVLTSLHRAGRLTKPWWRTIPAQVSLFAQAVQSDALRRRDRTPATAGFNMKSFDRFVRGTSRGDIAVDLSSVAWRGLTDTWRLGEQPFSLRDPKTFYTVALSELALPLLHSESLVLSQQMRVIDLTGGRGRLDAVAVWAEEVLAVDEVLRHKQWGQTAHFFRGESESGGGDDSDDDDDDDGDGGFVMEGDDIGVAALLSSDGLQLRITIGEGIDPPTAAASAEDSPAEEVAANKWNAEDYVLMLNDAPRNDVYSKAIAAAVADARLVAAAARRLDPLGGGSTAVHVLDIGSGEGLLSLIAARAGAERVTALETNSAIAAVSRTVIADNNNDDTITVIEAYSRSVDMSDVPPTKRPNLLVSEIVDATLFGEGILGTVCHATKELLAPHAVVLPRKGILYAAGVESAEFIRQGFPTRGGGGGGKMAGGQGELEGAVDLSAWNALLSVPIAGPRARSAAGRSTCKAADDSCELANVPTTAEEEGLGVILSHQVFDARTSPPIFLTEKRSIGEIDLTGCISDEDLLAWDVALPVRIEPGGTVDGVLVWFELTLSSEHSLNTGPDQAGELGHWGQALYVIPPPQPYVKAGDVLEFRLRVSKGSVLELLWK